MSWFRKKDRSDQRRGVAVTEEREGLEPPRKATSTTSVESLIEALKSPDVDIYLPASQTLAGIKSEEATHALLELLDEDLGSRWVRRNVVEALRDRDAGTVVPRLVEMLDDADYLIRMSVVDVLGSYGWEPSTARERAVFALSRSGDKLVMPADLEDFCAAAAAAGDDAVEPLENAFTSGDWRVHRAAVEALTRTGSEKAPSILERLASDYPKAYALEHDTGNVRQRAAVGVVLARDQSLQLADDGPPLMDVSSPGSPLVQISKVDDLSVGDIVRLWHDILGQWATGWLEVRGIVGSLVVFRDRGTGSYETRARSDIEDWEPPPLWRAPGPPG